MEFLTWFLYSCGYLAVGILLLIAGKKVFDLLTPYSVDVQLTEKDNPALGILLCGYLIGTTAIIAGVFAGESTAVPTWRIFLNEISEVMTYGGIGLFLLFISGMINDKLILHKFSNHDEVVVQRNTAVATVMGATYCGSGLIIAGGIYSSKNLFSLFTAFAVGQVILLLFGKLYQLLTRYDDQKELGEKKNLATGLSFGGVLIAYSMILMKGLMIPLKEVNIWTWADRLLNLSYYAVAGLILIIITRFINDFLFFPKVKVHDELITDRNINIGLMEAVLAISVGMLLLFCL